MKEGFRDVYGGAIALLVCVVSAGLVPCSASAATNHAFLGTFGSAKQPSFTQPMGLAIDQSNGDLLVVERGTSTLKRFNPDGTPAEFEALGTNVIDGSETPEGSFSFTSSTPEEVQVAVDNSGGETDGNIYVTQSSKGLIDIFAKDGSFVGQLTESSEGTLGEPCGVAVDTAGDVYVSQYGEPEGKVHKYTPAGAVPVKADNTLNFSAEEPCAVAAGAGPTAGAVFVASFRGKVTKFDGTSGAEDYEVAPAPNTTVAVDPASGHVFTAAGSAFSNPGKAMNEYDASGASEAELISSIDPSSSIWSIAVDKTSGNIYFAERANSQIEVWGPAVTFPDAITEAATGVSATSATLHGKLSAAGGPPASCQFRYTTKEAFEAKGFEGASTHTCSPPGPFTGFGEEAVIAEVEGLHPGTEYLFEVVASNSNGSTPGGTLSFLTTGPSVTVGSASQITSTGARISGEVNPRGKETSFEVQYVTKAQFDVNGYTEALSAPVPPKQLGSGTSFLKVGQQLSGLTAATIYRFRLVATNEDATSEGPEGTFTTFVPIKPTLPDHRAYEMVSPVPKSGGEVFPPRPVSGLDGTCSNCLPGINAQMTPMQARPDGGAVVYEGNPFAAGFAAGPNQYLSGRSSGGWGTQSLSPSQFANGRVGGQGYEAFSSDLQTAIVYQISPALSPETPTEGEESYPDLYLRDAAGALTPLVTEAPPNREAEPNGPNPFRIFFDTANAGTATSPPFTHIAFEANDALTGAAIDGGVSLNNLYEWTEGELRLVNVAPGNTTAPGAVIGSGKLLGSGGQAAAVDHAVSDDGSRIFWSEKSSGQLFVRIDGEETREIDDPGLFITADPEGTKVLLSDGCLYSVEGEECEADLTDEEGGFEGILGGSEDLSRIYFVDTKALTPEEEKNANKEAAKDDEFNLYSWDEGAVSFIGRLVAGDNSILDVGQDIGDWKAARSNRTAQASADGRFLAFMSRARLTGHDNGGGCGAKGCQEVFLYDGDAGTLTCPSCNPSGQRPLGHSNLSLIAGIPRFPPFRQPANLSPAGDGRLFFESQDTLSPRDTNGRIQDVYEWEPNGVGDCEEPEGCLSLISSGHAPNDSFFVDSTPSGDDAFLVTREQLLPRDKDELLDLYDARVGGGFPEGETAPCAGEACKGPVASPPAQPSAGSSEFSGPGNVTPKPPKCRRGYVRRGAKCMRKPHKHKSHHHRAAKHNRGGSK